ncbi:14186_t:CDS:10 [Ambispora leptoticha]|uniref:14186_t:CDS:1 n=1 Tax=Ambispora leptoticha TaxID=144679 RepID=A0A9N9AWE8_9GLOM|nr:14186_t:CDS:10 [Ambispora leptoticha]
MNTSLTQQALNEAKLAVTEDGKGNFGIAKTHYIKVIQLFEQIIKDESNTQKKNTVIRKCQEYKKRVEQLNCILSSSSPSSQIQNQSSNPKANVDALSPLSAVDKLLNDAQIKLAKAKKQDAQKNYQEALDLYTGVAEHYLKAIKETHTHSANAESTRSCSVSDNKLTATEVDVLFKTSHINGKIYYPWLEIDLQEQFTYSELFRDPDGTVNLSDKQKDNFGAWVRPSQITDNPRMIAMISSTSIIQDIVTDCSFVASLCVTAAYERRFKKQLITRCIYPQNKLGQPMYNPSGKYMIKLTCNGIARKVCQLVMVDDLLPVSRDGTLMCTFSSNKDELWASIIEKALMGGYDFPGSNSGIDLQLSFVLITVEKLIHLHSHLILTHVIITIVRLLVRVLIEKVHGKEFWMARILVGDALITIATGSMTDEEADLVGLVPTHAYAVLDAKEVNGLCLLQVKNPWSHKRWTGSFSHLDETSWTSELMKSLEYDRVKAGYKDDGVFWIDFDSVCKYFDSIHMNWNPELFSWRYILHSSWPISDSMHPDNINLSNNPQYTLEIQNSKKESCAVFLLLTKHITVIKENKDYITLHVYNCDNNSGSSNCLDTIATFGEKIYYPGKPFIQGVYINSPHILVRFNAPTGTTRYTIVVAQHEKMNSLDFTLRCYCTSPFTLCEIPQKYPIEKKIAGQWTPLTAGGNKSHITYLNNPQYRVSIPHSSNNNKPRLLIMLEGPKDFAVHVKIAWSRGRRVASVSAKDILSQSGDYRHGFCYCEVEDIQPGDYTIIVSTFEPGLCGDFLLTVGSNVIGFSVVPIPAEGAGMFKKVINGKWIDGINAMGCPNFGEYHRNPCYYLNLKEMTTIKVRLQTPNINPIPATNIKIFEKHASTKKFGREVASSGPYTNYVQGVCTEDVALPPHGYVIVFSTWDKGITGNFVALLYSDRPVEVFEENGQ